MIRKTAVAILISTLSLPAVAAKDLDDLRTETSQNNVWRLSKHDKRHEIKAYVKNEEGKNIRSFRVEAYFNTPIEVITRVQSDVDSYSRWYFATLESKLLKKVSDKEFIFYLVHDAPVGMPDRDVVIRATIEPMTAKKPYIVINMVSIPDFMPDKPPYVRMEAENYMVRLTPQGKNRTFLESEGFINPGGVSPSWAINFIQGKGPYANMMGMRRMVTLPQYNDATTPTPFTFFE